MNRSSLHLSLVAAMALTTCVVPRLAAQAAGDSSKAPAVTASLVMIGSNSDAYWQGEGPGMRAIPLDPGAAPPATLCVRGRKGFTMIPSSLNRPSIALPVVAGGLRVFSGPGASEEEDPPFFGNFPVPASPGHYDIFLNRAGNRKDWTEAESMVLASSTTAFPDGGIRIINLSSLPVRARIAGATVELAPRTVRMVPLAAEKIGKLVPVEAIHPAGDRMRHFLRTGLRLGAGQRLNLIFYPGRDAAKPCSAIWFYQPDPEVPVRDERQGDSDGNSPASD